MDKRALQNLAVNSPDYAISPSSEMDHSWNTGASELGPVYPLLVQPEKHEAEREIDTDWTTAARQSEQISVRRHSFRAQSPFPRLENDLSVPPTPPPVPEKLPSRPPSEKSLPPIDYPHVPFPVIANRPPTPQTMADRNPYNKRATLETEWDDDESRMSLTPTWVNGSSVTIDTVTHVGTVIHLPLKKEIDPSALEDQTSIWANYEQEVLPEKNQHRFIRILRHRIFDAYRRLFGLTLLFNICVFLAYVGHHLRALDIGEAVVWNLGLSFILSTDYCINAFFYVCTAIPTTWPLRIRKIAAGVYRIDGLHTGLAVSSVLWCIYFTGEATDEVLHSGIVSAIFSPIS